MIEADDVAAGIAEAGCDLRGVYSDGLDDVAPVRHYSVDGCGYAVHHDVDHEAGLRGGWPSLHPGTAYLANCVIKSGSAVAALADLPAEDFVVEIGGAGYVRGGYLDVTDFSVSEGGWHDGLLVLCFLLRRQTTLLTSRAEEEFQIPRVRTKKPILVPPFRLRIYQSAELGQGPSRPEHFCGDISMHSRLFRRVLLIAGLIVITLIVGTVGFEVIEGYSWFDGFYMTLTTITTVGYQELKPLSRAGRIFNSFLISFGVTAMFLAVGAMTQTIIELELQDRYGKRRKKRMIHNLHDHFIVCGFGRVGRNASYEIQRANAPFLVIDRNEQRVAKAASAGMLAVAADATHDDSLREAGVLRAKGLIAALPSDAENLFIILSAKTLNPRLTVVTRASEEEAGEKLRRAGADTVFTPYSMAGRQLADALLRPHVVEFLDFARSNIGPKVTMEQLCVAPKTEFTRKPLGQLLELRKSGVIVLAIRKPEGETIFNPPAEAEISAGDFLIVMGERPSLQKLEEILTS